MRVGVAGKTGSGKTTVAALLALAVAERGVRVLAVDADPTPNLAVSLGLGHEATAGARPVPRALIVGKGGGGISPERLVSGFGLVTPSGVTVLHAMAAAEQAAGCACAAHAPPWGVLGTALGEAGAAVLDLETGLEHLDRPSGTLAHVDVLLVVAEPSVKSSVTAGRVVSRAREHGIGDVRLVGNKAGQSDGWSFDDVAGDHGVPLAGVLPFSTGVVASDKAGAGLAPDGPLREAAAALAGALLL
ncbi:MAG TPA: AAA family ATPase [Acidimicrobiales bacterium]|nr:AAA family ATPase [Acidimicrobiales bacterium]